MVKKLTGLHQGLLCGDLVMVNQLATEMRLQACNHRWKYCCPIFPSEKIGAPINDAVMVATIIEISCRTHLQQLLCCQPRQQLALHNADLLPG